MSRFLRADACPSLATRSVGWDFSLKVRACASVTTASYAGSERRLRAQEPTVQVLVVDTVENQVCSSGRTMTSS